MNVATGRESPIVDLGPSPAVNNPVKGLSLTSDGRAIITSFLRLRGDLSLLEGIRWHNPLSAAVPPRTHRAWRAPVPT